MINGITGLNIADASTHIQCEMWWKRNSEKQAGCMKRCMRPCTKQKTSCVHKAADDEVVSVQDIVYSEVDAVETVRCRHGSSHLSSVWARLS